MPWLSIVFTYYKNPNSLALQLNEMNRYLTEEQKNDLEVVVVDDGSPLGFEAKPVVDSVKGGLSVRVLRVLIDVEWNHRSARNIGFNEITGIWGLALDIDTLPELTNLFAHRQELDASESALFLFNRTDAETRKPLLIHHDTYLIRKDDYWRTGGFDERFSGMWGFGKTWLTEAKKFFSVEILWEVTVKRFSSGDSQTKARRRKSIRNRLYVFAVTLSRRVLGLPTKRVLTFEYKEIVD